MKRIYSGDRGSVVGRAALGKMNSYVGEAAKCDIPIEPEDKKSEMSKKFGGRRSIFNYTQLVLEAEKMREAINAPLIDGPELRERMRRQGDCSIDALVDASFNGTLGRATYAYSNFMYCKHLGKVPNNYLITLRRFDQPVGDHINHITTDFGQTSPVSIQNDHVTYGNQMAPPDMGRLVTWMGVSGNNMEGLLSYSYHQDWNEVQSAWQDKDTKGKVEETFLGGVMSPLFHPQYQNAIHENNNAKLGVFGAKDSPETYNYTAYASWEDKNRPYGRANVITKSTILGGGASNDQPQGITFDQEFKITFEYEMRSYDGINQKAAFMDLLANILAVTFTEADFWGGGFRQVGSHAYNVYTNLALWKKVGRTKAASWGDLVDGATESWGQIKELMTGNKNAGLGDVIKGLINGGTSWLIGSMLNKLGRPAKQRFQSLLNPQPTGMWHLMIGNPKRPILSVGNLYLSNATVTHTGHLGIDDFPTGLKVEVTLKHGKPRSNREIEYMYVNGDSRIYQPLNNMYKTFYGSAEKISAKQRKSVDTNPSIGKFVTENRYSKTLFGWMNDLGDTVTDGVRAAFGQSESGMMAGDIINNSGGSKYASANKEVNGNGVPAKVTSKTA
jgi:hypothetical protein